ncbi:MAG: hypothetical protein IJ618_07275 [Prevotella sp.]|nr:hypothetical protein [Prevotella sp.]
MSKRKLEYYESRLREMIMQRREIQDVEPWLDAQVEGAAMNWQMMVNLHEEINKGQLMSYENGSMGQTKAIVNPLLAMYRDLQRNHTMNMEALGLNFRVLPKKMTEPTAKGGDEDDPMMRFLKGRNG